MSDPQWPASARSVWRAGVIVGYGLAFAILLTRLFGGEFSLWSELPGAVSLSLVAAVSPTLALLASRRRPGLLLPAGAIAILSVPALSLFGYPMFVIGLIWLWAHHQVAGSAPSGAAAALLAAVVLWFGAAVAMFIHLDPACTQTLRDGTVQEVDPAARGYETGWVWSMDSIPSLVGETMEADVVSGACGSDTLVLWEAAASITLSVGSVLASWYLVKPTEVATSATPEGLSV